MGEALMLVNVVEEEEARVAIVENNRLEEFYLERTGREQIVGSVYKGKVVNVQPSIDAAFVEFGYERHGFLHASDIKASVARDAASKSGRTVKEVKVDKDDSGGNDEKGENGEKRDKRDKRGKSDGVPLRVGDEILVQVTKEGIGDKGPALTTYLSLPGRYLVLMPGMSLRGVSRRIGTEEERRRVRDILKELPVPADAGIIGRTAGMGRDKRDFERDLENLARLWETIKSRAENARVGTLLYRESDQVIRVIRDAFSEDIRSVLVDSPKVFERVKDFLREVMPRFVLKVKLYEGGEPLFHRYGVEKELEKMHSRTVPLEGGGSIVLDQTEALVAIDVNSGRFRGSKDAEESAFRLNMGAAEEIARQVRLRDLGGLIVIDFVDMQDKDRRTQVEEALYKALSKDKARFRMLKMSPFCLVELTRQRRRQSLRQTTYIECPACRGTGHIKSPETLALEMIRTLRSGLQRDDVVRVDVDAPPDVANYLNNIMRSRLRELESSTGKQVQVHANPLRGHQEHEILFYKQNGTKVSL